MSKNIIIQEGGLGKQLTVDRLKTNLVGSGSCLWMPEDEAQLTTKTITENGTYKAGDDGYYGYSEVIVNIANAGTATGTDGDGDEAVVHTDPGTGELVTDKVPSSIQVITPPTNPYGIYQNGQAIVTDGMVVKSYLATGGEYGTVPNGEVTLDPTTAVYDASTDTGGGTYCDISDSVLYNTTWITQPVGIGSTVTENTINPIQEITRTPNGNGYCGIIRNQNLGIWAWFIIMLSGTGYHEKCVNTSDPNRSYELDRSITINKTTRVSGTPFGIEYGGSSPISYTDRWYSGPGITEATEWNTPEFDRDLATIIIDGNQTQVQAGSHQQITVSWPRPLDGKVLETTFEILVAPGYTPNGGEE